MPLIILGLLLLIGLLAYSIIRYVNSGEEDHRSVRERYPQAFPPKKKPDDKEDAEEDVDENEPIYAEGYVDSDSFRGDIDYMIRNLKETVTEKAKEHGIDLDKWGRDRPDEADSDSSEDDEESTIIFPTENVEAEKNKRNIH